MDEEVIVVWVWLWLWGRRGFCISLDGIRMKCKMIYIKF